jgi:hypothetical protein
LGRKFRIPKIWYIVAILHACCLLLFSSVDRRRINAQIMWTEYENSSVICPNGNLCKQILQGNVKKNETKLIYRSAQSYVPKAPRIPLPTLAKGYIIDITLPDKSTQSAVIIPNVQVNTDYFSFKDIYLPTSDDTYFAERYFPVNKKVKVEIWQGQITFIFTDSDKAEDVLFNRNPREIAIPTVNHPGIILILAQTDAAYGLIMEIIVLALTIFIAFRLRKDPFPRRKHASIH